MRTNAIPGIGLLLLGVSACNAAPGGVVTQSDEGALSFSASTSFTGTRFYSFSPRLAVSDFSYYTLSYSTRIDDGYGTLAGLGPNGPSEYGTEVEGLRFAPEDLEGGILTATGVDGATQTLRIDAAEPAGDTVYYTVSVTDGASRTPLCGDAAGNQAIALPGAWDIQPGRRGAGKSAFAPGRGGWVDEPGFFFACRGSSVAKCYEMGFRPSQVAGVGRNQLDMLEACVRALRADYCGDGQSHTTAGVELSVWSAGSPAPAPEHAFESPWDARGARCIQTQRPSGVRAPKCVKQKRNCARRGKSRTTLLYTAARR